MSIEFKKVSAFKRGILCELLKDAYAFNQRYEKKRYWDWLEFDNFYFDNVQIADRYGFITALNEKAIGFVSWDPRNLPAYVEIGWNCIASKYKGNGYGKRQLQEAITRIRQKDRCRIIVTTDEELIPAQRMYEGVGFKTIQKRKNKNIDGFVSGHIDYEYI